MGFHEVQFPTDISFGSSGGPGFATQIIVTDSGAQQIVTRWSAPLRQYNVAYGIKSQTQMATLIDFYVARQGATYGFRYWDPNDYTTGTDHIGVPGFTDVQIGIGNGSTTTFQLIKKYSSGGITRNRTITKPVTGTTVVALNGVQQMSGWTVNTTSGVVTFTSAPGSGVVVTAGFQFDTPVRFTKDADALMTVSIDAYDSLSSQTVLVQEIRPDGTLTEEFFYGGAEETSLSANYSLSATNARVQSFDPTVGSLVVNLPPKASIPPGEPIFYIVNVNATNSLTINDVDSAGTVVTLTHGTGVEIGLTVDGSSNKVWYAL